MRFNIQEAIEYLDSEIQSSQERLGKLRKVLEIIETNGLTAEHKAFLRSLRSHSDKTSFPVDDEGDFLEIEDEEPAEGM